MSADFDLIVIGAGPGGYVAAIRAAQLGLKTACVEGRGALGGTCLNVGCMPSKVLLHSTELFSQAQHEMAEHGVLVDNPRVDFAKMMARKDKVVKDLTTGVEFLFKKNKVTYVKGWARITGQGQVTVTLEGAEQEIRAKSILIATGSEVTPLPGVEIDEEKVLSSTGALSRKTVPEKLIVIGAGVIGLEMGSVYARLGANVTVVEFLDRITPGLDGELSKSFQRSLKKQGLHFMLGHKVKGVDKQGKTLNVQLEKNSSGEALSIEADAVLVAIGRRPVTAGLGLQELGVTISERGQIEVNGQFETNIKGIYAIGDVIKGPMLAHKAEEEGVAAVEMIAGQKPHVNYNAIPSVVYTNPEAASVGKTEEELKAEGLAYKVGKFAFMANSRARAIGATEGFVKILADAKTDRVLGAHILGQSAGELIQEIVSVIEFGGSAEDIARTCHAHPCLSEAIKEAALAVDGRQIHA